MLLPYLICTIAGIVTFYSAKSILNVDKYVIFATMHACTNIGCLAVRRPYPFGKETVSIQTCISHYLLGQVFTACMRGLETSA